MEITTIFVIKNRPQDKTMNCIESLYRQNTKIILVDYGSNEENIIWERILASRYNLNLIEVKNDIEVFNKSRALNIGIKYSDTNYIMCGDIDNIYMPNFIEEIEKVLSPKKLITCRRFNTSINGKKIKPSIRAYGGCLVAHKDLLVKIRGFDEMFTMWGGEDDDLIDRINRSGIDTLEIQAKSTSCIHQWHKPANKETLQWNRKYAKLKKPIIRNRNEWGKL
jgi:glycosyltransferase involved in cell wall biosynthesis